jgi:type IV pilus biogenesis protein CpaD/CtpE
MQTSRLKVLSVLCLILVAMLVGCGRTPPSPSAATGASSGSSPAPGAISVTTPDKGESSGVLPPVSWTLR